MSLIKWCLAVIGIIGVLAFIALIIGYFLFSLTPSIKADLTPVVVSAEAAQSFDQKFKAFETELKEAVADGEEKEISMVITEQEVNNKILDVLAEGELPLKKVLINFEEDYFLVFAIVDITGADAKTGLIAETKIVKDNLKIAVKKFDLGKLPLPQCVDSGVEKLLNIMIRLRLADLPMEISKVEISDSQLIITGLAKIAK